MSKKGKSVCTYSSLNYNRLFILNDNLTPSTWKTDNQFPYKGLFISSQYLIYAYNKLTAGKIRSAWASATLAYYYLGIDSSARTAYETSKHAATIRHANESGELIRTILSIVSSLINDKSLTSRRKARDRVIEIIESNDKYWSKLFASHPHTKIPEDGKKRSELAHQLTDRLADRIDEWCESSTPHPEIKEAFSRFIRKNRCRLVTKGKSAYVQLPPSYKAGQWKLSQRKPLK